MLGLGNSLTNMLVPAAAGGGYTNAYSLEFDGTDDYVEFSNSLFQPAIRNSFTITMWLKIPETSEQIWFSAYNGNANKFFVNLEGTSLNAYFSASWDDLLLQSTSVTVPTNEWFHFAITCLKTGTGSDPTVIEFFINGTKYTPSPLYSTALTAANQGTFNLGSNHFRIGYDPARTANKMLDGTLLHELSLHEAVLSDLSIAALADAPIDQTEDSGNYSASALIGYWKLDEGTGTTATDSSASGVDGNLATPPAWSTDVPG